MSTSRGAAGPDLLNRRAGGCDPGAPPVGHERTVDLRGRPWHIWEGGTGPSLVFVHGAGSLGQTWSGPFPEIASSRHVVLPDLPGFGQTPGLPDLVGLDDVVGALAEFLDIACPSPVDLAGSSLGGTLVAALAAARPGRVRRLILVAPAGVGSPGTVPSLDQEIPPGDVNRRLFADVRRAQPHLPKLNPRETGERWKTARSTARRWLAQGYLRIPWEDLSGPTLVVWGELDAVLPVSQAQTLANRLSSASLSVMPGVGHLPHLEAPKEFAGIVERFLHGRADP